ncbi:MAG TPA: enoyl-CoA hydratase/isomerase family protein, partial [Rhodopila sp.]|nr:enoyl-CoA hydratase/isomerase family protein [Rhodopila sp.]
MAHQFCTVQDEGRLRIVTLNRPEVLNALHADANDELSAVWDEFAARDDLWVGIVTGAGPRAFSAGNDLKVQAAGKRRPNGPNGFAGLCHRFGMTKP